MKLINNRYRIEGLVGGVQNEKGYIVEDLWNKGTHEFMRILDNEKQNKIISKLIETFLEISQIRHKNLLSSDHFNIIETINLKKTDMLIYYAISELSTSPKLNMFKSQLSLEDTLELILDLMSAISYLNFRGIIYRFLTPSQILYSKEKGVKLLSLASLIEMEGSSYFDSFNEDFIAPELKMNVNDISDKADYYSIGMIMKYLLYDDYLKDTDGDNKFKNHLGLNNEQKDLLGKAISNLTNREASNRNLRLKDHIQQIITVFGLNYNFNFVEERTAIFLKTKIVGRENELNKFQDIVSKINNKTNEFYGAIINGNNGVGKTRLLNEITYKLKMSGSNVYKVEIIENDLMEIKNISNFLKLITTNAPLEIINRYRDDFSGLIPELALDFEVKDLDINQVNQRYRIFNRIGHFLSELTHDKMVYFAIDNFEKSNELFILLIDYLLNICIPNRLFFIFTCDHRAAESIKLVDKLQQWDEKGLILDINLNNLGEDDTGILVKSILGISYMPKKFAKIVHRESKGNPGYIDFIIKDLLNRDELYINDNGNWATKEDNYSDIDFPTNFCDTIKTQINKLESDQLQIIRAMSIFNTILSKRTLLSMVHLDADKLDSVLNNLINEGIVEEQVVEWGFNYNIVNDELKRFVYLDICESEKLMLHQVAATALTELYSDRIKLIFDELIHHLIKSNREELALDIIVEEAEKIENKYSSNSIILWEKAYSIIKDKNHSDKAKILNNLTDIFLLRGDIEKTETYLKELKRLSIETNDLEYLVKSIYYQADIYLKQNQNELLEREMQKLEDLSRKNNLSEGIIYSAITKGRKYLNSDNVELIQEIMDEAIEISKSNSIYEHLGSIYTILGYAEYLKGNTELAIEKYTRSIDYFEASGNVFEVVKPINNLGVIYSELYGDFEKGLSCYEQGLEVATKYGFGYMETLFLNNIGEVYINSLDYYKALDYITRSLKVAQQINDYRLIFLSNVNLGFIYLFTNQLDSAYSSYLFLVKANALNPVLDDETVCQYNNFLGEFYFIFGNLDLALKHSKIASDSSKDFNIKEYLRAESRMAFIDYKKDGYIDKERVNSAINKYQNTGIVYENLKNILTLSKLCIINNDKDTAIELYNRFNNLKGNHSSDCLEYTSKIIKSIIDDSNTNEIEAISANLGSCELLRVDTDLHYYLGLRYMNSKEFPKALRQFLDALDYLYKTTKSIPDGDLKFNLIKGKKGDVIKEKIDYIYRNIYGKDINTTYLEHVDKVDYNEYFDFSQLLQLLTKDEFNEIVDIRDDNLNIKSMEELLLNISDNYQSNLDLILNYICNETVAQKGYIINLDESNNHLEVLSSYIENDSTVENERMLFQFLRNKGPILINRNNKNSNSSKYEEYLSNELTGIICVPINMNEKCKDPILERRKWETSIDNKFNGYIYLETSKVFNRFDLERFKLICSLSNLIYLNIENNSLKLISTTDKLTGTLTRKYFDTKLDNYFDKNKHNINCFSLLMIDIDDFKKINDAYGHPKGDEVLTQIGKTIKNNVRASDIVGRYGGEEFIVLLKNTTIENGLEIGEKIRSSIESIKIPGVKSTITVSIGMSQYPDTSQFKEDLISKADQALYNSKQTLIKNQLILWHEGMEKTNRVVDKITGIITGNAIIDNRNILATIGTAELIGDNRNLMDKTYDFLGRIIEIVEGECASLILLDKNKYSKHMSRIRKSNEWVTTVKVNKELVKEVIINKKGEYIIDWHNTEAIDKITCNPNWQSVLLLPLIKEDIVLGLVYISAPLKEKEFNSQDFNIANLLCNIFVGNLS